MKLASLGLRSNLPAILKQIDPVVTESLATPLPLDKTGMCVFACIAG